MARDMRDQFLQASRLHFQAHIEKHRVNVENLLENAVGVGEHGDVMDTIEKEMEEMARYHDLLEMTDTYFNGKPKKELINERT
jgi:hypothetical protein